MRGTAWRGREAKPARQPERRPRGVTDVAWAAVARPRDRAPACSCDPLGMPRAAAVMRRRVWTAGAMSSVPCARCSCSRGRHAAGRFSTRSGPSKQKGCMGVLCGTRHTASRSDASMRQGGRRTRFVGARPARQAACRLCQCLCAGGPSVRADALPAPQVLARAAASREWGLPGRPGCLPVPCGGVPFQPLKGIARGPLLRIGNCLLCPVWYRSHKNVRPSGMSPRSPACRHRRCRAC